MCSSYDIELYTVCDVPGNNGYLDLIFNFRVILLSVIGSAHLIRYKCHLQLRWINYARKCMAQKKVVLYFGFDARVYEKV